MKNVIDDFKIDIRTYGRQFDVKLKVNDIDLSSDYLNYLKPSFNTSLFKTVMHQIEIDTKVYMPTDTKIAGQIGVKVNEKNYNYIDLNTYYVKSCERQEDTNSYKILAYTKMKEAMIDSELELTEKMTVRNYLIAVCQKLNWNTENIPEAFINSEKLIDPTLHIGIGYTYRDILDEIATITCSFLLFKGEEFHLIYPTETNQEIDESYLDEDNITIGEKYLINSLVFSRVEESDNIYRQDSESIELNGIHEYKISDCQLLSTNDRVDYIDEMFEYLKTLEFYIFDVQSKGILFLEVADIFSFKLNEISYKTILLNNEIELEDGLKEKLYTDEPEETETEYKYADSTDKKINQCYALVDKQNQKITLLSESVEENEAELNAISTPTALFQGKSGTIDSAEANLDVLEIRGESTQKTRAGINLLKNTEKTSSTSSGVTFTYNDEDGTYTANGTNDGNGNSAAFISDADFTLEAGTYYTIPTGVSGYSIVAYDGSSYRSLSNTGQFTLSQDTTFKLVYVQIAQGSTTTANNFVFYPIISKEPVTADSYEPYGVMPSPDYPSEIESVSGRNVWDSTLSQGALTFADGSYLDYTSYAYNVNKIVVEEGKTYKLSADGYVPGTEAGFVFFKDDVFVSSLKTSSMQITIPTGVNQLVYDFYKLGGLDVSKISNIKLVELGYIGVKSIGKNLFHGKVVSLNNDYNTTPDYIEVLPNTQYVFSSLDGNVTFDGNLWFYTRDKAAMSQIFTFNAFTTPEDCYFVKITAGSKANLPLGAKIQLEQGTKATNYEEYQENIVTIPLLHDMRSLPNGTYDRIYKKNGKWYDEQKVMSMAFDGSEDWYMWSLGGSVVERYVLNVKIRAKTPVARSNRFIYLSGNEDTPHVRMGGSSLTDVTIFVPLTSASNVNELKTWLSNNNVEVQFELIEPIITEITDEATIQALESIKTFKGTTNITSDAYLEAYYYTNNRLNDAYAEKLAQIELTAGNINFLTKKVDDNTNSIASVVTTQTEQNVTIDVLREKTSKIDIDGNATTVKTETGFTFDAKGLNIAEKKGETVGYNTQITTTGTHYKDGTTVIGEYTKDGSKQKNLELFGVYSYGKEDINDTAMFVSQLYTDENGEKCVGHFYNGG